MASEHETKCFRLYFDNDKDMKVREILNNLKGQSVGDFIKSAILAYNEPSLNEDTRLLIDTLSQINANTHIIYDKLSNLQVNVSVPPQQYSDVNTINDDIIPLDHDTDQELDEGAMNDLLEFMNV